MSRIPKEPVKLVEVPSTNKIPERDIDKSPILECRHLGIDFGGLSAVKDFNMAIGRTEIAGLIGPNGAGKTTVFNLLTKVYQPTPGHHPGGRRGHPQHEHRPGEQSGHRPYLPEHPPV